MPALIVSQRIWSGDGFSRNAQDVALGIGLDEPVRRRVVHRRQHDRRARFPLAVKRQHRRQVHRRQHVAVEHDDRLAVRLAGGELDGAAGAERRRLDDVAQLHAEVGPVAEHLLDAPRLIVEAQDDLVDLRHLPEQVDLVPQKRPVEDRHDRFRRVERQRPQPRALPSGEQNGLHGNQSLYQPDRAGPPFFVLSYNGPRQP